MKEEWVKVINYPDYLVSNYGKILNAGSSKSVRPRVDSEGYLKVRLYNEDGPEDFYIHQLVGMHFLANFSRGTHLKHYDGNKSNNKVTNLRLRHVKNPGGVIREPKRDTWGKRIRIVEIDAIFRTVRECARHINGDYSTIYRCLRGERSSHLGYTFEYVEEW